MEGSVAGPAAAQGDAQAGQGDGAQGTVDLGELAGRMDGFTQGQEELRGLVQDLAGQLTSITSNGGDGGGDGGDGQDAGDIAGELDLSFLDDETLAPEDVAQHFQGLIDTRAQQIAAEQVNPVAERLDRMDRRSQLAELVADIPDMGNEQIANQVVQATSQMADAFGWDDSLKQDPRMYRMVYLAAKAQEIISAEGDGDDVTAATLEGGGGARAGGAPERDLGKEIVDARRGKAALPFG